MEMLFDEHEHNVMQEIPSHQESPTDNVDQIIEFFQEDHHYELMDIEMQLLQSMTGNLLSFHLLYSIICVI